MIDDSEEFFEYMAKPIRPSIRINTLKADGGEIRENLERKCNLRQIPWCSEGFYIDTGEYGNLMEYRLGLIFPQESASMIPPLLLDLSPNLKVLDMCAAPGAKTTQIAQYMENRGCIIANEPNARRINILISNLQRCGVLIAQVTKLDGRFFSRCENSFDSVLVDAPRSNGGMIRKNFKYLKFWRKKEIEQLSKLQKSLIISGYRALKPGGVLVYSTCTMDPLENEEVVNHLLMNTDAEMEDINLPLKRREPFQKFGEREYTSEVRKCLRIHPQDNDTEGFFVARIRKP
jgi:NOL1/NOP2/sun family putative RNA methylase